MDTDEHDGRAGDYWGEDTEHDLWWHEAQGDFEEGAKGSCAENSTVGIGARELGTKLILLAKAILVHLVEGTGGNGNNGERDTDDRDQTSANVVGSALDVHTGNLDSGEETGDDEGGRDEVLSLLGGEVDTAGAGHDDWRCDDTSQHGKSVLEAENQGKDDGHAVVEAEEWWSLVGFGHEGEVRPEKECVVIVADETILGSEGLSDGIEAIAKGLLGRLPRDNLGRTLILIHGGR